MELELENVVYPLSRYSHSIDYRLYHVYHSTPAQDFLHNCAGESVREPAVLALGCGDISSCFYSLWKNFDANGLSRFDGVHFVMNDNNAAVHARNILFLYLCLRMPEDDRHIKKWLCGIWAIWFCHELYPEHIEVLDDSLRVLCRYSDAWSSECNPLHPLVKFSSPSTLKEIKAIWVMWLQHNVDAESPNDVRFFRDSVININGCASRFVESNTEIPFHEDDHDSKRFKAQKSEVIDYLQSGNAYAENVLEINLPGTKTFVNLTFYDLEDGHYSVPHQSLPFSCFHQTMDFSDKQLQPASLIQLLVKSDKFVSLPFLANSVQQFSLWLLSSHKVLSCDSHKAKIFFTFDCSHALSFCYELENNKRAYPVNKFDLVYASTSMDLFGPPNLILSAVSVLKENGVLLTTTLYRKAFSTIEKYLESSFGFDCKLLPVILGIRCINHEGGCYTSPVTVKACPFSVRGEDFEFSLMWEKVEAAAIPPFFSPDQQLTPALTSALLGSIEVAVYSLLEKPEVPQVMSNLCVETAVKVLQVFMSNVCADFNPHFWKPLSDSLQDLIQPYLHNLQTQLILHGIHMHLTISEENCAMCLQDPSSVHIGLFSTKLSLEDFCQCGISKCMAIVHMEGYDDVEYLCNFAREFEDIHIFDCISPSSTSDDFLRIYFYAPLSLAKSKYKVTIVAKYIEEASSIQTQLLSDILVSFRSFKFFQPPTPRVLNVELGSFGTLASHKSGQNSSDIVIDLSEAALSASTVNKLQPKRLSSSVIELSYGLCSCQLKFLYPIGYGNIKIKVTKKDQKVFMHCPRAFQQFAEEKPTSIISPDKELSLLPYALCAHALPAVTAQRYLDMECKSCNCSHQKSRLVRAMKSLFLFFETGVPFYHFVLPHENNDILGLVLVNNWLFDYENRIPVIDIAFCFLDMSFKDLVLSHWKNISPSTVCKCEVDYEQYEVLKEIFYYFARRTNGTCTTVSDSSCYLNLLTKEGIQQYFTRAVISLLLYDPHHLVKVIEDQISLRKKRFAERLDTKQCDNCSKLFETTKFCSGCKMVRYCTRHCQDKHWKIHKIDCKKFKKSSVNSEFEKPITKDKSTADTATDEMALTGKAMAISNGKKPDPATDDSATEKVFPKDSTLLRPFPIARYWFDGSYRFYYPFGNTPAEDFLQNCTGVTEPKVLSLGCGDLRSCFYTLWKNCDMSISRSPKRFDGVHFVLNDWSTSVLARNVVFMYMCHQLPKNKKEAKKWLSSMWAIWYCHEYYPQHQKVLDDCLKLLLKYCGSLDRWANSENPLHKLVRFTSSVTLCKISQVWKTWLDHKVAVRTVEQIHSAGLTSREAPDPEHYAFYFSHSSTFINGESSEGINDKKVLAGAREVLAYIKSGNCYAEKVLKLKLPNSPPFQNITLYERAGVKYVPQYDLVPFHGYYHTLKLSPDALASAGVDRSLCDAMLVKDKSFESLYFLSSSVQQFTMWVQSASNVLNDGDFHASFTFNDQHALSFCQELQHSDVTKLSSYNQYDLVYTSNLVDHLGPPSLVLCVMPLVKLGGLLFSTSMVYRNYANDIDEFLRLWFGFDCKLMPVLLGIRCINHEGTDYSSPFIIQPIPVHSGHVYKFTSEVGNLVWEKVSALPFVMNQLPALETGNVTDALFDFMQTAAYPLLSNSVNTTHNSIETAMAVLQTFMSSVVTRSSLCNDYHFWEPLSLAIVHSIKPFLHGLQTQALLHDLHMHLTVNEDNCPLCRQSPLEQHIGLFCAEVRLPLMFLMPHFMAIIHRYSSSNARYLCNEAKSGNKDIHIIDCIDGTVEGKTLKLKFFAPLKFVKQNYKVMLALTWKSDEDRNIIFNVLPSIDIKEIQIEFMQFNFSQAICSRQSISEGNSFGELTSHICDGDIVQSEISLSDSVLKMLNVSELNTKKLSSSEIEVYCGKLQFSMESKYPIYFKGVSVKLSEAQRKLKIVSPREAYEFHLEKPIFLTMPDHQLALPPQILTPSVVTTHSFMQMSDEESQFIMFEKNNSYQKSPWLSVKESIMFFFNVTNCFYFRYKLPENKTCGRVVINQSLFYYQHRAPAVDLAFCFSDSCNERVVTGAWKSITRNQSVKNIFVDSEELELLNKILNFFAERTNGSCRSSNSKSRYQVLCQHKIDQHFTRAVVHFLYREPEKCGLNEVDIDQLTPPSVSTDNGRCDYCSKPCVTTKMCRGCYEVQYCSKNCRNKHWLAHSRDCSTDIELSCHTKAGGDVIVKCSFCNSSSGKLKKCTRCSTAQYCGKHCQTKHWPIHKMECKKSTKATQHCSSRESSSSESDDMEILRRYGCASCGTCTVNMVKCKQCGITCYCGKQCQTNHWPIHKMECKMLPASAGGITALKHCACCGAFSVKMVSCESCGKIYYCGMECRRRHWEDQHHGTCKYLQQLSENLK